MQRALLELVSSALLKPFQAIRIQVKERDILYTTLVCNVGFVLCIAPVGFVFATVTGENGGAVDVALIKTPQSQAENTPRSCEPQVAIKKCTYYCHLDAGNMENLCK